MTSPEHTPPSSKPSCRRRTLRKQLAAYSVAAAGTALAAGSASAAVVPIQLPGGQPIAIQVPGVDLYVSLDIDGDGNMDFTFANYLGVNRTRIFGNGSANEIATEYMVSHVREFAAGNLINGQSVVINGFTALDTFAQFEHDFYNTREYAGVIFDIPGGSPHYAYLDVGPNPSDGMLTLFGGAWESQTGVGIVAGAVPEPTGLGLLAMGAAGVVARRRERSDIKASLWSTALEFSQARFVDRNVGRRLANGPPVAR